MVLLGALALLFILLSDFYKYVTGTFMGHIEIKLNRGVLYSERAPQEEQWLSTYKQFRMVGSVLWWLGLSLFCILFVVSFLIGMFRDVDLGARVLGYGIALMSFPAVIVVSLALLPSLRWKLVQLLRKAREGDEEIAISCNSPEPTTRMAELASDVSNRANSEDEVPNE
ncbi:hypothetical protein CSIM01_10206 [Colletotrichum simmondsii]|uniref:Uncharacterized protein n=1 Tax=Colletotrichum simmondsii TaxID=703756 RepID=A0A135SI47_9PEZI|nr:hypothetical protein CSIM01_10206 [Colletotrichum simmondsii]